MEKRDSLSLSASEEASEERADLRFNFPQEHRLSSASSSSPPLLLFFSFSRSLCARKSERIFSLFLSLSPPLPSSACSISCPVLMASLDY